VDRVCGASQVLQRELNIIKAGLNCAMNKEINNTRATKRGTTLERNNCYNKCIREINKPSII
jgi:hypothetical protein